MKYAGAQVAAMQCIAKSSQDRSVAEFKEVRDGLYPEGYELLRSLIVIVDIMQACSEQKEHIEEDPVVKVIKKYIYM